MNKFATLKRPRREQSGGVSWPNASAKYLWAGSSSIQKRCQMRLLVRRLPRVNFARQRRVYDAAKFNRRFIARNLTPVFLFNDFACSKPYLLKSPLPIRADT